MQVKYIVITFEWCYVDHQMWSLLVDVDFKLQCFTDSTERTWMYSLGLEWRLFLCPLSTYMTCQVAVTLQGRLQQLCQQWSYLSWSVSSKWKFQVKLVYLLHIYLIFIYASLPLHVAIFCQHLFASYRYSYSSGKLQLLKRGG